MVEFVTKATPCHPLHINSIKLSPTRGLLLQLNIHVSRKMGGRQLHCCCCCVIILRFATTGACNADANAFSHLHGMSVGMSCANGRITT